jgi:lysine/ornithine N-monooxygenase
MTVMRRELPGSRQREFQIRICYRIVASRILALDRSDHDASVAQMKPTSSRATAVTATGCGQSGADRSETIDAARPTRTHQVRRRATLALP